jgi:hypothetical protein
MKIELEKPFPDYCPTHDGWTWAKDWTPEGYGLKCGCRAKIRTLQELPDGRIASGGILDPNDQARIMAAIASLSTVKDCSVDGAKVT